jgi:hypothetical protein
VRQATTALSVAHCAGFHGMAERLRNAVMASERLVAVLERIAEHGLRRPKDAEPLSATEVREGVRRVREAVAELAGTTPEGLSDAYAQYTRAVEALVELANRVLQSGVRPAEGDQPPSPWDNFRPPPPRERPSSQE